MMVEWFVMTHLDMPRFKGWLVAENAKRLGKGEMVFEPFYPSDFLRGEGTPGSKAQAAANTDATASDLARFVFLKSTESELDALIAEEKKLGSYIRLMYYTDTDGRRAVVPEQMMQDFFDACLKYRGFFEIVPSIQGIEAMDKVRIKTGPFAGKEASVVRVQHSKGEVHLELAIELVTGVLNIKMTHVDRTHITVLNHSAVDAIRTDFIEYTQTHLLTILEHRVKGVTDESVRRQDVAMLTRLYRYRSHQVENAAAQTHFLALMLICAHLCRYTSEANELTEQALSTLAAINKKSESKAATDTRAYLWIALYIATRDPAYRDSLKQYIRDYQPKSERLRRFVSLIRTGKKI